MAPQAGRLFALEDEKEAGKEVEAVVIAVVAVVGWLSASCEDW